MPVEGRGLSSRQTQQAVRDREIGQPSSLSDWSLADPAVQCLVVFGGWLKRLAGWQGRQRFRSDPATELISEHSMLLSGLESEDPLHVPGHRH
jgi:hypothetical protein